MPEKALKGQYRDFLKQLELLPSSYTVPQLKSVDAKELIQKFFNPADTLFEGIEMVMQAIAVCYVKQSCESILESMVSMYKYHFDGTRNMEEEDLNEESFIAINGPNLSHCNSVIEEAMNRFWKDRIDISIEHLCQTI